MTLSLVHKIMTDSIKTIRKLVKKKGWKENKEGILEIRIKSLSEYCEAVDFITLAWRKKVKKRHEKEPPEVELFPGELSPWFRGITEKKYELEPSLLRNNMKDVLDNLGDDKQRRIENIEEYLLRRFKTFSSPSLQRLPKEKIEWFFMMQHHKLPTRLLDWSKSSFIALFFAIRKYEEKSNEGKEIPDAAVWMLEPRRLSEACHSSRSICGVNEDDEDDIEIINRYMSLSRQMPTGIDFPLPVIPNIVTPRIGSQIGRFTLHTHARNSLVNFAKKLEDKDIYLVKFRISASKHRDLMRSLRVAGISHMNISQDLDGIADELMWRVRLGARDRSNDEQNQAEESPDSN